MLNVLFHVFAILALLASIMVIRSKNPVYAVLFLILVFCNASGLLLLLHLDFFAMVFLVVYVGAIAVLFLFVVMMLNVTLTEINDNILRYVPVGGLFGLLFLGELLLLLEHDFIPLVHVHTPTLWPSLETLGMVLCFVVWSLIQWGGSMLTSPFSLMTIGAQWSHAWQHLQQNIAAYHTAVTPVDTQAIAYVIWPHTMEQTTTVHTLGHVIYTYHMALFLLGGMILLVAMVGAIVLTMHKGVMVKRQDVWEQNMRDFSKTVVKLKQV